MLPPVLRFNEPVNAERQAWVSEALGRPGEKAADAVAELVASLGLPGTLRDVGVKPEQLDRIAEESMHDRWVHTNPRKIAGRRLCARCSMRRGERAQSAVSSVSSLISSSRRNGLRRIETFWCVVELRHTLGQPQIGIAEAGGEHDLHRYAGQQDLVQHVDAVLLRHDHVEHDHVGLERDEGLGRLVPSC